MKTQKFLPVAAAIALGFAVVFTLQHARSLNTSKKEIISSSNTAAFTNFDFTEYSSFNQKKYTITGRRLGVGAKRFGLFRVAAARITEIRDARVTFYENNTPVSTIMAKSAIVDLPVDKINMSASSIGKIDFYGDVSIITADRKALDCDNLRWDKANNRVLASGKCVLTGANEPIKADSIESDVKLRNFVARNNNGNRLSALKRAFLEKRREEAHV